MTNQDKNDIFEYAHLEPLSGGLFGALVCFIYNGVIAIGFLIAAVSLFLGAFGLL